MAIRKEDGADLDQTNLQKQTIHLQREETKSSILLPKIAVEGKLGVVKEGGGHLFARGDDLVRGEDKAGDGSGGAELDGEGERRAVGVVVVLGDPGARVQGGVPGTRGKALAMDAEDDADHLVGDLLEVGLIGGGGGDVGVGAEDELGVRVNVEGGDDVGEGGEVGDERLHLRLRVRAGAMVSVAGGKGAGANTTPLHVVVSVEINSVGAAIVPAVLPPEAVVAPGEVVAVRVDKGDDHELGTVEELGHGLVNPIVVEDVVEGVLAGGAGDPLAGVDVALNPDFGPGRVRVGSDPEGKEVAVFPGLAHSGHEGGKLGELPGEVEVPRLGIIVGVVLVKPGERGGGSRLGRQADGLLENQVLNRGGDEVETKTLGPGEGGELGHIGEDVQS